MTDDAGRDHAAWSELAVAHALDVLEPAESAAFVEHLAGCPTCRALVAEASETMADLAETAPPLDPPPDLRERVLAAAATGPALLPVDEVPAEQLTPDVVTPEDLLANRVPPPPPAPPARSGEGASRLPAGRRMLALAAVVVLVAAGVGALWGVLGRSGGGSGRFTTVAARCAAVSCPTVRLTGDGRTVAQAMILDGTVYLQPAGLTRNDPSRDEYVLWRLRPGTAPAAVGGFDVTSGQPRIVTVGRLGVPLAAVQQLAITREPGRAPPRAPSSTPLATGTVAATRT